MTLTPVRVKDCPLHPDGHSVFVSPTISLPGAIAAEEILFEVMGKYPDLPETTPDAEKLAAATARSKALTRAWAETFVRDGAKDWDFCDEQGKPLAFDVESIIADYSIARRVAEKLNDLGYGAAILAPFIERQPKPSPTSSTGDTTSRRRTRTKTSRGSR